MTALLDLVAAIKGATLTSAEIAALEATCSSLSVSGTTRDLPLSLFDAIAEHLEEEEGRVRHAYRDHLGYLTIGVGRLIDARRGGGLSDAEIDMLLVNDILNRTGVLRHWPAWQRVQDDPVRAAALVSMAFQLGTAGLAKFKRTLSAITDSRFDDAAHAMLASHWARQTPARATRVAAMISNGRPV